MALGHGSQPAEDEEPEGVTESRLFKKPATPRRGGERRKEEEKEAAPVDRRWLSTGGLADWRLEDRWWLAATCTTFLDTKDRTFGRKRVFLVDRKEVLASNPEVSWQSRGEIAPERPNSSQAVL
jgi:hypothetical protein